MVELRKIKPDFFLKCRKERTDSLNGPHAESDVHKKVSLNDVSTNGFLGFFQVGL